MIRCFRRCYSAEKIRNVGIIAHIDAGKTTTTERFLYYSGYTRHIGEVDSGNTVMDFMDQEQERGITIQAAAITFNWQNHDINLIDTPGHADFTLEVQRSLRVLDGAVAIFDAVHGVQAQTRTVWRQATQYGIPKIALVNKMDKDGSNFGRVVYDIQRKLHGTRENALPCQIPIFRERSKLASNFDSVVDLVSMKYIQWNHEAQGDEMTVTDVSKDYLTDNELQLVRNARTLLVECLSDFDDDLMDEYLKQEDPMKVSTAVLKSAIRKATLSRNFTPIFCGASFKNIGVQPVLDAIIDYLPSPLDRPSPLIVDDEGKRKPLKLSSDKPVLLAFKVAHDLRKGLVVFARVYSGKLKEKSLVFNARTKKRERILQLCQIQADSYIPVEEATNGQIVVLLGLKEIETGDTLLTSSTENYRLDPIAFPRPVFTRAVEPNSSGEEKELLSALQKLKTEDPSLELSTNDAGQILISGMGELHLEVALERLKRDYKIKCKTSPVWISYRETIKDSHSKVLENTCAFSRLISGKLQQAELSVVVSKNAENDNKIRVDLSAMDSLSPEFTKPTFINPADISSAIKDGINASLSCGPLLGFPLTKVNVDAGCLKLTPSTSTVALFSCASKAVADALRPNQTLGALKSAKELSSTSVCTLLEPVMNVRIEVPSEYLGQVVTDLTGSRHGQILKLDADHHDSVDTRHSETENRISDLFKLKMDDLEDKKINKIQLIDAVVPVSGLVGYSVALRSLTKGHGQFTMEFRDYAEMTGQKVTQIIKEFRGF